jgi:hypothetical protein
MSLDLWERNAIRRHSRVMAAIWTIGDIGYYFSLIFGIIFTLAIPALWAVDSMKRSQWTIYPWLPQIGVPITFAVLFLLSSSIKGWVSSYGWKRGWVKRDDYHDPSLQ